MDFVIKIYKDWKLHSQFTEIVPDDMDDDYYMMLNNEKQSIRESARSLKKYGSTCNHVRNNEVLIRHEIDKTDTLQGISLKYGCTMEQIRRANRLFASDSLFLRQFLLIPVDKASPYYPKDDRPQSLPSRAYSVAGAEFHTSQNGQNMHNSNNNNSSNSDNSTTNSSKSMESIVMSPEEENKKSIDEFLGKIDSTIAESKKYVARSHNNSTDKITNRTNDDLFSGNYNNSQLGYYQSSAASTSSYYHNRHLSSGSTSSDTVNLINLNQGRRVQNSLQRLEKQQDEFFEL